MGKLCFIEREGEINQCNSQDDQNTNALLKEFLL